MTSLPIIAASSLADRPVPDRQWIVSRLVPSATLTVLSGDGGSGKSTVGLQLAVSVATGTPVFGLATTPGEAIVVCVEDDAAEVHRRVVSVAAASGVGLADLGRLHLVLAAELGDPVLARDAGSGRLAWTELFDALRAEIETRRPRLVVLDPVAELFAGNEIDRRQVTTFAGELRRLAQRTDTALLLIAHPSVTGLVERSGRSGSTAWANSARQRIFLERVEGDTDVRKLTITKSNVSRHGDGLLLAWRDGAFEAVAAPSDAERADELARAKHALLALIKRLIGAGRTLSPLPGRNSVAAIAVREPEGRAFSKETLKAAMADLIACGAVRVEEAGPQSRQRAKLVVAEAADRRPTGVQSPLPSALRSPSIAFDRSVRSIPPIPPTIEGRSIAFERDRLPPPETDERSELETDDEAADAPAFHF